MVFKVPGFLGGRGLQETAGSKRVVTGEKGKVQGRKERTARCWLYDLRWAAGLSVPQSPHLKKWGQSVFLPHKVVTKIK